MRIAAVEGSICAGADVVAIRTRSQFLGRRNGNGALGASEDSRTIVSNGKLHVRKRVAEAPGMISSG